MIIKYSDSREADISELESLLSRKLTSRQRFLVEREILSIKKGARGERDSAYYINFYYGDSRRWIVIHDLRIELNGRSAQIDHILINRLFDVYVLESKCYGYGLRITDTGEFEVCCDKRYVGIPSPIEQNKRHIALLSPFIEYHGLMPKRLPVPIKPCFLNYVLVSPKSVLKRPDADKFDSSAVIKADSLTTVIEDRADSIGTVDALSSLVKMSTFSQIEKFGRDLVKLHRPASFDWKKKFGIHEMPSRTTSDATAGYYCAKCKVGISAKVARFCWSNKKRFKGKAFCIECQKEV